ncbi:MAG TPA: PLD nuclease N-terminal domain-containing protein [Blastocatellia bacterium]|nr:PLD nuclease N-terminal domain-containing protein [Blastocatellia bacterium]
MSILGLIALILSGVAIYDIAKSDRDTTSKAVLIILVLLFPIIGPIIYLTVFKERG